MYKKTNVEFLYKSISQFMPLYFCYINPVLHRIKTDKYHLNENQIKVIMVVNHIGKATPTQISHALLIQKGSLTTIIRSLYNGGFLRKARVVHDERKYYLHVSERGKEFIREKISMDIQQFDKLFRDMPDDDLQTTVDGLNVLTKYLIKAGKHDDKHT